MSIRIEALEKRSGTGWHVKVVSTPREAILYAAVKIKEPGIIRLRILVDDKELADFECPE